MKKYSKKMNKINNEYSKLRLKYLTENPMCKAKLHNCTLKATEIHHTRGRVMYHLAIETWLGVCRNCHTFIENNPEEAKELKLSNNRL